MSTLSEVFIGVDVCKAELVVAYDQQVSSIKNNKSDIERWLKSLPSHAVIALEATNSFHFLLADMAYAKGMRVYVLNPKQVSDYRKSLRGRAKTDRCDARIIARFITKEHQELFPYVPLTPSQRKLVSLLRRRTKIVQARVSLQQSLESLPPELLAEAGVSADWKTLLKRLEQVIKKLDKALESFLEQCELSESAARLRTIDGVGAVTSAALLAALSRGEFACADAFVAFLGLDLRVEDSGVREGRRRLTKRGDGLTRALLYTAAMSAVRTPAWKELYRRYLDRGLKRIQALVIIARRIAKTAWSIYKHGGTFSAQRLCTPLT